MIAASLILCWAAYLSGEAIDVSGVIATVTAGLVYGWYQHVIFTANVRIRGSAFWQVMVFLFEAMVFVLIGFSLRGVMHRVGGIDTVVATMAIPALGAVLAMTVSRFAWIFGSDVVLALLDRIGLATERPLGLRASTILGWAGMRGVVTLAIALTLPKSMPGRDLMLVTAFAAILVTVLIQGGTLGIVIRLLRLVDLDPPPQLSLGAAEAEVARAQLAAVSTLAHDSNGSLLHPRLLENYERRALQTRDYSAHEAVLRGNLNAHFDIVIAAVAAGRAELVRLHRAHEISDETLHNLERDLDLEELGAIAAKG